MMGDDFGRAIVLAEESLHLAEGLGLEATRARNLNTLGVSRVASGDAGGIQDLERAMEIAAAVHSYEEVGAAANLTWMVVLTGDLRRAGELHEQSRALARRIGVSSFSLWQDAEHVFHCHWEGRWDEALSTVEDYLHEIGASGHYMESSCRNIRAAILGARGEVSGAADESRLATKVARPVKDPQTMNPALAREAQIELVAGNRARATVLADELVEVWHATGIRQPHELALAPWVFRELGREQEILAALESESFGSWLWHDAAQLIASGDLADAAEVFARIGSVPDEAYARLKAAEALVAVGNRAQADRQLALALPLLSRLGATAWLAEAESLLSASA
jgi:predicted RecB family endonuclease